MASTESISLILGTIGTVLWCVQLIPQIIFNHRRKSTEGLPQLMIFLWLVAGVLFAMYFITLRPNVALEIQPVIFTFLTFVTWGQCLYYGNKFSIAKVATYLTVTAVIATGLQVAAVFPIRNSAVFKSNPTSTCWPLLLIGVLAAIALAVGLVPPYFDLAKRQGQVVGINFIFLAIDSTGAVFSFASLLVQKETGQQPDYLGMVLYLIVPALEIGIVVSHFVWWIRIGRRQDAVKKLEKKFIDDADVERDPDRTSLAVTASEKSEA
ncbi:PQ loop repeat-domain-containing protein [Lipomyces japonicus]|uniref:PQ loop repeat-domain-containing protein n=1 Tax=Lipomyces japonicus TaxID=56871 RepID=UPI0034CEA36A